MKNNLNIIKIIKIIIIIIFLILLIYFSTTRVNSLIVYGASGGGETSDVQLIARAINR